MIFDRLDNAKLYRGASPAIAAALDYLAATDFHTMPDRRYELAGCAPHPDGGKSSRQGSQGSQGQGQGQGAAFRLVAIVQRYRPKPLAEVVWEAHRKHIDVQYIVSGAERIGHALWTPQTTVRTPYDQEKDAAFYDAAGPLLTMRAGMFAVFFPHDIHAPCLIPAEGPAEEVLKVVVKIPV